MSKLGVHALVWVGGWSEAECTKAIRSTAELGYDFIEIPLLNPYGFPVEFTRARLEEHKLGATASLGPLGRHRHLERGPGDGEARRGPAQHGGRRSCATWGPRISAA